MLGVYFLERRVGDANNDYEKYGAAFEFKSVRDCATSLLASARADQEHVSLRITHTVYVGFYDPVGDHVGAHEIPEARHGE